MDVPAQQLVPAQQILGFFEKLENHVYVNLKPVRPMRTHPEEITRSLRRTAYSNVGNER
jgi:hypothetical protein